jgi:hypothetical protein
MCHHMKRLTVAAAALVMLGSLATSQEQPKPDQETEFRRSDAALVSATGRPQLVEFFHPE